MGLFHSIYWREGKSDKQPNSETTYTAKVIWDFVCFFGMLFAWQKIAMFFSAALSLGHHWQKKIKWTEFDWSKSVFLSFFILLEKVRLHEHYDKNVFQTSSHLTEQTVAHAMLSHGILCLVAKPSRGTTHSCFEIVQMGMNARASRNVAGFFFALTKRHMTFTKFKQTKKHWM